LADISGKTKEEEETETALEGDYWIRGLHG
jgi:hypothetical protein